jgi:amidophosphoribosyltransferase
MCGIIGIHGPAAAAPQLIFGMAALQHRGQDAAGVITYEGNFHVKKGLGSISTVFKEKNIQYLKGRSGIGHVRYATQGGAGELNAQPFHVNYPFGIAMAHNGNVVNFAELKKTLHEEKHRLLDTTNDLELLLYTFASELEEHDLKNYKVDDIFDCVAAVMKKASGAYSVLAIIAGKGLLAFTDPGGIRPLVMGRKETSDGPSYIFASETVCFDYLGFEHVRDFGPGEAVFIDDEMNVHSRSMNSCAARSFCVFEYIYFSREDSRLNARLVAGERVKMGRKLARRLIEKKLEPDIVIDIPSSSYFVASGLAEELNIPYRRGFARNNHIGRSFIMPSQIERELAVRKKLNPIREIVAGKKIVAVDDSIVRGTTSKHLVKLLKDAGAKEVYYATAAPPVKFPCIYGIDMSVKRELLAGYKSEEEILKIIGADALIYQSLEDLKSLYEDLGCCYACFSGEYPTGASAEMICEIEKERICSKRE